MNHSVLLSENPHFNFFFHSVHEVLAPKRSDNSINPLATRKHKFVKPLSEVTSLKSVIYLVTPSLAVIKTNLIGDYRRYGENGTYVMEHFISAHVTYSRDAVINYALNEIGVE